jgi:hypothetical protein
MTPVRSWLCGLLSLSVLACHGDAVTASPVIPLAGIHFVNAVPDTAKMDFRVVDIVSNAGLYGAAYRGSNMFYTGIEAGNRHIRVFFDTSDVVVAQTVLSDTAYAFAQNQDYTFVEAGFARPGQLPGRAVWVIADNAADPGANVGLRVVNAGAGIGAVDVNVIRRPQDTLALPLTPLIANVAYGATASGYVTMAADTGAQAARVVFTAAGTLAPIVANVALPTGVPGTPTLNPIAGARIPGSVITAVLVPASPVWVPPTFAPKFATPGVVVLVDRRPPNTAP